MPNRARLLVLPLGTRLMAGVGLLLHRVQLGLALVPREVLLDPLRVRLPPPGWN